VNDDQLEEAMKVSDVMTGSIQTCLPGDTLAHAAQLMWENDCGCVPVVDQNSRAIAMLTDRDICMAAYTQDRPISQISVSAAASQALYSVRDSDHVEVAEKLMQRHQVRRLPVLDGSGRIMGVVSLNDLARRATAQRGQDNGLGAGVIARTLAAIGQRPGQAAVV
jgi:CBS domain-containing protein